jgi:predicted RNA-binding Zn-ribbon protein involved in translation (DUF1610 family)
MSFHLYTGPVVFCEGVRKDSKTISIQYQCPKCRQTTSYKVNFCSTCGSRIDPVEVQHDFSVYSHVAGLTILEPCGYHTERYSPKDKILYLITEGKFSQKYVDPFYPEITTFYQEIPKIKLESLQEQDLNKDIEILKKYFQIVTVKHGILFYGED